MDTTPTHITLLDGTLRFALNGSIAHLVRHEQDRALCGTVIGSRTLHRSWPTSSLCVVCKQQAGPLAYTETRQA